MFHETVKSEQDFARFQSIQNPSFVHRLFGGLVSAHLEWATDGIANSATLQISHMAQRAHTHPGSRCLTAATVTIQRPLAKDCARLCGESLFDKICLRQASPSMVRSIAASVPG